MLIATSGIGDDSHREPVSKVHWIKDTEPKSRKYNVSVCIIIASYHRWGFPEKIVSLFVMILCIG